MNKKIILLGILLSLGLLIVSGSVVYSKTASWQNSIVDGVVNKVSNGILSLFLEDKELKEVGVYRERGIKTVTSLGAIGENLTPDTNNSYHIGSPALSWRNIYASGTLYVWTSVLPTNASVDLGAADASFRDVFSSGTVRVGNSSNNYVVIGNDTLSVGASATKGLGDFAVSADGSMSTSGTIQVKSLTATSTINGDLEVDTTLFVGTAGANQVNITNSSGAFSFAGNSANSSILGLNRFYSGVTTGFNAGKFSVDTNGGLSSSSSVQILTTATSTLIINSGSANKGACLVLKDFDGLGVSYCTSNDGVLTCSQVSCQ